MTKKDIDMKEHSCTAPDWDLFGDTPKFIAAGLRVRPELVLAYLSSTLGGLSGAFARMDGSSASVIIRRCR